MRSPKRTGLACLRAIVIRLFAYPEEEQDGDQSQRIERLPQTELGSLCPLVIASLQRILLEDSHLVSPTSPRYRLLAKDGIGAPTRF